LLEAAREYDLDLAASYMIGDRSTDLLAGRNAGAQPILVLTGVGRETLAQNEVRPVHVAADVAAAADWILAGGCGRVNGK
jgi:Histidinol phosphatase and related phosphatases